MPPFGMVQTSGNEPRIDAEEILAGIERWVAIESPSSDPAAVNRVADAVQAGFAQLGSPITRIPGRDGRGDHLEIRSPWGNDQDGGDVPGILVLCHMDTVHPHGTDRRNAFRREGDRVYGPGIYDMKGGAYLAFYALQHLVRLGRRTPLPITFLYVSDEEVGSTTSRAAIEAAARRAKYVLVTEPARDGGKIVTARKGVGMYGLTAHGRPAHSASPQNGRSAVRAIAHAIVEIEGLTDYETGVTASVGIVDGGTEVNVVPAHCSIDIDLRLPDAESAERVTAFMAGLTPKVPDVTFALTGGLNRPPFTKSEASAALLEQARSVAAEIGIDLQDVATGGGSDGNFTAALGLPTLDGLGVDGAGAHTLDEYLLYSSLEPRARLMLRLFETLR